MTIDIRREGKGILRIPYRRIIEDAVLASLDEEGFPWEAEVSVTITDGPGIRELNRDHRGIDSETDVLSFPMLEYGAPAAFEAAVTDDSVNPETGEVVLGDIVLNAERVISQAAAYGHTQKRELAFLVVHSMLHLMGYDHMEDTERLEMEEKQRLILNSRGYTR